MINITKQPSTTSNEKIHTISYTDTIYIDETNSESLKTRLIDTNDKISVNSSNIKTNTTNISAHKARLDNIDITNTSQSTSISAHATRLTNIETKNTEQDTRLTNVEFKNTSQDTRLTTIEAKNTSQDTRLTTIEAKNTSQDIAIDKNTSNISTHTHLYAGSATAGGVATSALTATKLTNARTINGSSFDGTSNISTINWGTARVFSIGNTNKSVDGGGNTAWTLAEIGALPLSGGTLTGDLRVNGVLTAGNKFTCGNYTMTGNEINSTAGVHLQSQTGVYLRSKANYGIFSIQNGNDGVYMPVYASGYYTASSIKCKENIQDMVDADAEKILKLNVKSFDYKENYGGRKDRRGLIAEEVKDIIPQVIEVAKLENGDKMLNVDYTGLIPHLLKMVQIQQTQINDLKNELLCIKKEVL